MLEEAGPRVPGVRRCTGECEPAEWSSSGSSRRPATSKCVNCDGDVCADCGQLPAEDGVDENGVDFAFCSPCVEKVPGRAVPYEPYEGTRAYEEVRALLRQVVTVTGLSLYRVRATVREEIGAKLIEADLDQLR
jgi:hypothetical protein